jgi:hypothetical protein
MGGVAMKFVSPNYCGFPARLVLLKAGRLGFAEVKQIGGQPQGDSIIVILHKYFSNIVNLKLLML